MKKPCTEEQNPVMYENAERLVRFGGGSGDQAAGDDAPVLRVAGDGEVLEANEASLPLLAYWNLLIGDRLPGPWLGAIEAVLTTGEEERVDLSTETNAYSLTFTPAGDGECVILSVREAAESRGSDLGCLEFLCGMQSGVAIFSACDNGRSFLVTSLNPAAEQRGGVGIAGFVGRRITDPSGGAESPGIIDALRRVWKTGSPEYLPLQFYRDGRLALWCEIHLCRLPSGEVVAVVDDKTEQKRMETSLIESEEKFRGIAQRSFDLIFMSDRDGAITYASPAVQRVLGCAPDAITGRRFREYVAHHNRSVFLRASRRLLAGQDVEGLILECVRNDGSPVFVEINASPIVRNGVVTGIQGVGRDVTGRISAEHQKKQAYDQISRNIEQFAILGDHIRQPLQVILGTADIIGDERSDTLVQQVRRINNIIRQLDQGWIESRKVQEFLRRYE